MTQPERRLAAFKTFLRIYGVLTLAIFGLLLPGFVVQSPLLAEHGGSLNWTIWNDVRCGSEHLHVPPMLMVIYIVWGVFLLRASRDPLAYSSFLDFTMWANLAHGVLMAVQAVLALGIYLWRRVDRSALAEAS